MADDDHAPHDHAGHGHSHGDAGLRTSSSMRRALASVVGLLALVALIGAVLLRPDGDQPVLPDELGFAGQLVHATATEAGEVPCQNTVESDGIRCNRVEIELTSGPTDGETGAFELPITDALPPIEAGDRLVVQYLADNPPELQYFFQDYQRGQPLVLLVVLFAVAVVALGRWQGLRALGALAITGMVLIGFAFPSILDGHDPTTVALVAAAIIALLALYLTHGVTEMITVALLGTVASLAVTAVLAIAFTRLAGFTGFGSEDAFYLQFASAQIDVKGLVLAGIIVGSLGVLDDVTVTQASAVWQLHAANPTLGARRLYSSAVTIGRDHIASTVNTLVLAYAGASLPLLLIFAQAQRPLAEVATGELVAVEIVRTLVGSIGLVAAVPVTTALATLVVTRGAAAPAPTEAATQRAGGTAPLAHRRPEPSGDGAPDAPEADLEASWDDFAPDDDPRF